MEAPALLDAHVQLKRIYAALNEALDLTRQLADAVDRDDQVSVRMLISMRQEPTDSNTSRSMCAFAITIFSHFFIHTKATVMPECIS